MGRSAGHVRRGVAGDVPTRNVTRSAALPVRGRRARRDVPLSSLVDTPAVLHVENSASVDTASLRRPRTRST